MTTFFRRDFQASLREGQIGESAIATMLRNSGFSVLPVYEVEEGHGKGPRIFAPGQSQVIAPDMFIYNGSTAAWVEAKHKTGFTYSRRHQKYVTGIDLKHYEHYCEVALDSPFPVYLMFLQRGFCAKDNPGDGMSPSGLYGGNLEYLKTVENHRHEKPMPGQPHGMVYWAEDKLIRFADYTDFPSQSQPLPLVNQLLEKRHKRIAPPSESALKEENEALYEGLAALVQALWEKANDKES